MTSPPADLQARRARLLGPAYRLFYDEPLHPVRGDGVWLFDADGRRYLDAYNNVASVGHCRPEVVQAIAAQAAVLNTHTRYLHEGVLALAERLLATLPAGLQAGEGQAMFTCTGSEANDLALRIAQAHTGGSGLIITQWAYHGVTAPLAGASPSLGPQQPLGDNVATVALPLRAPHGEIGPRFAEGVRQAIASLRQRGLRPAALLLDTVCSSDGVLTHTAGWLTEAVAAVRAEGGVFIADEVQPGFGRTGEAFWGFARHGTPAAPLVPDIVTLGKPMGNGHPVAGLVARAEVLAAFGRQCRYFNTFGGNPVAMAAANAVLDVIAREGLQANALRTGALLREQLAALGRRHAAIGAVRGAGLFIGLDLVDATQGHAAFAPAPALTQRVVNGLRQRGVLISATGPEASTLKIRPPLVFAEAHAALLVETLDAVLTDLENAA
ncbi:aspartate aminotransferase family protein [Aquabacterium sp. OR-4]|uniref:aspartate aminotransferase family protein n=1 Tax=Aquabacterium sp. OR-4 TaxID=2978127 RepID=UPI0021B1C905|nr:aspartate aminotransferase family protein [Aquabacterium sp. OR-4]MDT7838336.1 aspartate aminotransferase family protein [Aquabacterium sp. OR-4]